MRSAVAEKLREADRGDSLALSVDERIEQALALGRRDVEFYMAANDVDRETAVRRLRQVMRQGRTPSKCMDERD
jgi:hypothetical protein